MLLKIFILVIVIRSFCKCKSSDETSSDTSYSALESYYTSDNNETKHITTTDPYSEDLSGSLLDETFGESDNIKSEEIPTKPRNEQLESIIERKVRHILGLLNEKQESMAIRYYKALWKYKLDRTEKHLEAWNYFRRQFRSLKRKSREEVLHLETNEVSDYGLKRQIRLFSNIGEDILEDLEWDEYHKLINNMTSFIKNVRIPHMVNSSRYISYEEILKEIRSTESLSVRRYYWTKFYDMFGSHAHNQFSRLTELTNIAAFLHGYSDIPKYTYREFHNSNVDVVMALLYRKCKLLYRQLHAYVRYKLRQLYGYKAVGFEGHIPMHVLGDLNSNNWLHLYEKTKPYPHAEEFNLTNYLLEKNFTVEKMARSAETFFTSMYLKPLPPKFWKASQFEKPSMKLFADRCDCTTESMDLIKKDDYRLRMCGEVNEKTYDELHHHMGHLQYMMQYARLPFIYRQAPIKAFHEGVAILPGLTVKSLTYQYKMQFINEPTNEQLINYLYKVALDKVVYIPYAYAIELFRWMVLNGTITSQDFNVHYWRIRRYYTGVAPAGYRTPYTFDAAANFDIASNNYLPKNFFGNFLGFSFHDALCRVSSHFDKITNPDDFEMANCDLFGEKTSGAILEAALESGASKTWASLAVILTKSHQIKAYPTINFFRPLFTFLRNSNNRADERLGWF